MLITIGWATTSYMMTRRWLRQRMAWQWWHRQQVLQSHDKAESIRDGLLQQTFAFRRYLESIGKAEISAHLEAEQTDRWLERFQTFYQSLERLSNELSPPFVADSLPLALQFMLKDWQKAHPIALQCSVPADWPYESGKNQVVVSIVTSLLTGLVPKGSSARRLTLTLSSEAAIHTLTIELEKSDPQALQLIAQSVQIDHLKEIFQSLAAGRLEISHRDSLLTASLSWRDRPIAS